MVVYNALDTPGGVKFFHGHGPAPVLGPCLHNCPHRHRTVIAWGPDWERYELIQCDQVCAGQCRGWKRVTSMQDRGTVERWLHVGEQTPLYGVEQVVIPTESAGAPDDHPDQEDPHVHPLTEAPPHTTEAAGAGALPSPAAQHRCGCGRTFKSAAGLGGHRRWCNTTEDNKADTTKTGIATDRPAAPATAPDRVDTPADNTKDDDPLLDAPRVDLPEGVEHGTNTSANRPHGCKCAECREAKAIASRKTATRRKLEQQVPA